MININVPTEFKSDGCTFPGILKILSKPLGADRYREYCREHDFLRRHDVIHWFKANWLLARRIAATHPAGWVRAPFYLIFTTISYPFYDNTTEIPSKWLEYYQYYRD